MFVLVIVGILVFIKYGLLLICFFGECKGGVMEKVVYIIVDVVEVVNGDILFSSVVKVKVIVDSLLFEVVGEIELGLV